MTVDDLKETAALAHLNLNDDELSAMLPAFKQTLEYFSIMKNADDDCEAFPYGLDESDIFCVRDSNFFRSDIEEPSPQNKSLINNAVDHDGRFIIIPKVL